jgi:hypothetical protein
MAYTQADLEAIRALKLRWFTDYEGAKQLQLSDRNITFRSLDELEALERQIVQAVSTRPKQTLGYSS